MHHDLLNVYQSSARHSYDLGNVLAAPIAAPVGHPHPPLASSGDDQLRVPGRGPLDSASSSLSPTSLLFPLPPSHSVAPSSSALLCPPPSSSSSGPLPSISSSAAVPSSFSSSSFSPPFPPSFLRSIFLVFHFFSFFLFCYCLSSSFGLFSFPYPFSLPLRFCCFFCSFLLVSFLLLFLSSFSFFFYPSSSWFSSFLFLFYVFIFSSTFCLLFFFLFSPSCGSSSSSSSLGLLPSSALADHQARLLGLSPVYQSLARWFVTSGGTDFAGLVRSSFPHLLPDVARDFASDSSLFLTTLHSGAPPSQAPPPSSVSSATHPPLSAHLSSASLPGLPPHPSSLAQFHPSAPPVCSLLPPPPRGFSHPTSSLAFPIKGSSEVLGLGVDVPSSSGVPRSPYYMSAAPAYGASTSASWHPPSAYPPDPFVSAAPHASANPFPDEDEHYPEDDHAPIDSSAPPLSLDSARS